MINQKFNRNERLTILAQTCTDNNVTPQKGNYSSLTRRIAINYLNTSESQAKELTRSLTTAYYTDRWLNLLHPESQGEPVEGNSGLTVNRFTPTKTEVPVEAEQPHTPTPQGQDRDALRKEMHSLFTKTSSETVKKIEAPTSTQQDQLTEKEIAKIFYGMARRDTYDGVGRLILSDCRDAADNKHLTVEEVLRIWRTYYPLIDAENRSNVILIYWDGKESLRNVRAAQTPIVPPTRPVFDPKKQDQGDAAEDDEGVVPEQELNLIGA